MNNTEIVSLAKLIASGVVTDPALWGIIVSLYILALAVKSYLPSYVNERAKIDGLAASFGTVLAQLRETTSTTKSIELSLAHRDWTSREYITLRRTKLEEVMLSVVETELWVERMLITGDLPEGSPISTFSCISQLYFPEMLEFQSDFEQAYLGAYMACLDGRGKIRLNDFELDINKVQVEAALADTVAGSENTTRTLIGARQEITARRSATLAENADVYAPAYEKFSNAAKGFKGAATRLMASTITVATQESSK